MAKVRVRCPNGHELSVPEEYLGKKGRCKHCQALFVLQLPEEEGDIPFLVDPDPGQFGEEEGQQVVNQGDGERHSDSGEVAKKRRSRSGTAESNQNHKPSRKKPWYTRLSLVMAVVSVLLLLGVGAAFMGAGREVIVPMLKGNGLAQQPVVPSGSKDSAVSLPEESAPGSGKEEAAVQTSVASVSPEDQPFDKSTPPLHSTAPNLQAGEKSQEIEKPVMDSTRQSEVSQELQEKEATESAVEELASPNLSSEKSAGESELLVSQTLNGGLEKKDEAENESSDKQEESPIEEPGVNKDQKKVSEGTESPAKRPWHELEREVQLALDRAIGMLERNDYRSYAIRYMPVDQFRSIRREISQDQGYSVLVTAINGKDATLFVEQLKQFQGGAIKVLDGGFAVEISPVARKQEPKPPPLKVPEESETPEPERKIEISISAFRGDPSKGYGSDLNEVIRGGIQSLKEGKYEEFVEKVYPLNELVRLQEEAGYERLIQNLKNDEQLIRRMIGDLEACAAQIQGEQSPKAGTVWDISLKRAGEKGASAGNRPAMQNRLIKFELVEGNWRFFNNTSRVQSKLHGEAERTPSQRSPRPPVIAKTNRPPYVTLMMEKIGSQWRIQELVTH